MADRNYDRLNAQDSSFVLCEGPGTHMHVSVLAIVEAGSLRERGGGLDIERLHEYVQSRLHVLPRYRKRLEFTPLQRHPIWVDDSHFNLRYHVRLTALPGPGSEDQLKELTGRILSQQLDRDKPLWEIWFIDGLKGDRCAVLPKVHHSMARHHRHEPDDRAAQHHTRRDDRARAGLGTGATPEQARAGHRRDRARGGFAVRGAARHARRAAAAPPDFGGSRRRRAGSLAGVRRGLARAL